MQLFGLDWIILLIICLLHVEKHLHFQVQGLRLTLASRPIFLAGPLKSRLINSRGTHG